METMPAANLDSSWFSHDRFGMFIHWGLYSNPAGVWNGKKNKHGYSEWLQASEYVPRAEYRKLAERFDPGDFNADEWIVEAKNAGMRYVVITAKHHDGFCLWPSKATSYNVMDATPFKRDILRELADACAKHDIKLGFYYSHWQDWEGTGGDVWYPQEPNEEYVHPTAEVFAGYWKNKCLVQVRELLEAYDPWLLWFDSWNTDSYELITPERQDELIDLIRRHSKKCLVNSRIQFRAPSDRVDFMSTMDNSFPDKGFPKPWETSGTLNHSWGYHSLDFGWRSTRQLIRYLVANASLGGNYQLNVGPTGNGCFQDAAVKRLRDIGNWIKVNSESIYGTQASTLGKKSWGKITTRRLDGNKIRLYLHLWDVTPGTGLMIDDLTGTPSMAYVLETGQPVLVESGRKGIWVEIPRELEGMESPVIAVDVEGLASPLK